MPTEPPSPTPSPTSPPTPQPSATPAATPTAIIGKIRNRPGRYYDRLILRNYPRWFMVHVPPSYQPTEPTPLIFNLHGLGSNLEQQERLSNLSAKADEAGFIVVYPQAGASVWNIQAGEIGDIDVSFFRAMLDYLEGKLNIDPARIYATGFSNGGGMVHRLACDLSDRIAAVAPVSGAYSQEEPCKPEQPVAVLAFHGTADPYAPFQNEKLGIDIPQWAADWANRNQCDTAPLETADTDNKQYTWTNCNDGASVTLYVIEGMSHTWPSLPEEIVANDIIWEFFKAHSKP